MTQEDFGSVSSRTYVSSLERAEKSPTLDKVAELAAAMALHPVTLMVFAWTTAGSSDKLLARVAEELELVRNGVQNRK